MKIVVIGGTGLIGSKSVAILRQGGHEVIARPAGSGADEWGGRSGKRHRDNPAMSRLKCPRRRALAVAYYKVEDGRVVLLHTEVPQELSGLGYGSRLAHGVFEALRRDGKE